jgi:hypothetical protein
MAEIVVTGIFSDKDQYLILCEDVREDAVHVRGLRLCVRLAIAARVL